MAATASSASVMAFSVAPPTMMGFSKSLCASSSSSLLPPSSFDSLSLQASLPSLYAYPSVTCGRGDKRTTKGKRFLGSYGNSRPRKPNKGRGLPEIPLPPRPPKKDPLDDGEFVEIVIDENLFKKKA